MAQVEHVADRVGVASDTAEAPMMQASSNASANSTAGTLPT